MSSTNSFGQNEWLVDDMYQQFKKDPKSVDKEWRELFEKDGAPDTASASAGSTGSAGSSGSTDSSGSSGRDSAKAESKAESKAEPKAAAAAKQPKKEIPDNAGKATQDEKASKSEQPKRKAPTSPMDRAKDAPEAGSKQLKGMFKAIAKNMDESLEIPTATTVRDMPVKLMWENRSMINDHLKRTSGGKISFTHIVGYAIVRATMNHPDMNVRYEVDDSGKPQSVTPEHINLGLAIDLVQKDGSRALVVAAIKEAEKMNFAEFVDAYDDIVSRSQTGDLKLDDYQGVTISLTNPGGLGTRHSIPRLTKGQGTIIGMGSMDYPAEFAGTAPDRLAEMGVGRLLTLTSTYDHRVIQGAESGEFLRTISQLIVDDKFWDHIFDCMHVPYAPQRWAQDLPNTGIDKNTRVMQLIEAYRSRGHLIADSNPLNWTQPGLPVPDHRDLDPATHGLTIWDLDRTFHVGGFGGQETMTLREVLSTLRRAYTLKVGSEYTHILDRDEREWLRDRLEAGMPKPTNAEQKYILQKLNAAEAFENFLQTKYVGQKRFSLEGSEALIPLMDAVIDTAAGQGLDEVVIGMAHRGRLNVLFNIVGKPLSDIFHEFEGRMTGGQRGGSGDVKYHLGAEGEHIQMFGDGEIKVSLAANPSHLEAVDPVLVGMARAKQDILDKGPDGFTVVPLMVHGDASFTGLGVVQETINLSQLRGYTVGGTIHVVVNNQVGFTTTPDSGRSTYYATDLAKGFDSPVFHVNGDDPEAVVWVAQLATEYRRRFGKDVFIDLISYRLRGHNEADDPTLTQPEMYGRIIGRPTVREKYTEQLIGRHDLSEDEAEAAARDFTDQMDSVFNEVKGEDSGEPQQQTGITESQKLSSGIDTSVDQDVLDSLGEAFVTPPEGFDYHKRVKPIAKKRAETVREGGIDWAWAELLAFGSLAQEGKLVRIVGEDTRRGTFTQRHAVAIDYETGAEYNPLNEAAEATGNGGRFMIYNSALTEFAGVGFEYGYSVSNLDSVVAWEAQFGDFVNGAQTIIDSYISSGEAKWGQLSNLILLLPHGYEGQGPDHSSARVERFLQLAAEGSYTVAQPTIPANYFHLLRRHALGTMRRPLIVLTPKSMLRNKAATSDPSEFTEINRFQSVINDPRFVDRATGEVSGNVDAVKTVMLCTGKIYYELEKKRAELEREDVAIVRIEMIHPLPFNRIKDAFDTYPNMEEVRFVQDEPANQGAWPFINEHLPERIPDMPRMKRVSRRAQSSTATGIAKVHQLEEKALLNEAFDN